MWAPTSNSEVPYPSPDCTEAISLTQCPTPTSSTRGHSPWPSSTSTNSWTPSTLSLADFCTPDSNNRSSAATRARIYQHVMPSDQAEPDFHSDWHLFQLPQPISHDNIEHFAIKNEMFEDSLRPLDAAGNEQLPFSYSTNYSHFPYPTALANVSSIEYNALAPNSYATEACDLALSPEDETMTESNVAPSVTSTTEGIGQFSALSMGTGNQNASSDEGDSDSSSSEDSEFAKYINLEETEDGNHWRNGLRAWSSNTCDLCGKRFVRRANLVSHVDTHGENRPRPFHCTYENCSRRFLRAAERNRHVESVHVRSKNHVCECGDAFPRADSLKRHKNTGCRLRRFHLRREEELRLEEKMRKRQARVATLTPEDFSGSNTSTPNSQSSNKFLTTGPAKESSGYATAAPGSYTSGVFQVDGQPRNMDYLETHASQIRSAYTQHPTIPVSDASLENHMEYNYTASQYQDQNPIVSPMSPSSILQARSTWHDRSLHDSLAVRSLTDPSTQSINPSVLDRQQAPRHLRYITRTPNTGLPPAPFLPSMSTATDEEAPEYYTKRGDS